MNRESMEKMGGYLYIAFAVVFGVSLLFMMLLRGLTPLPISLGWSEGSLVVAKQSGSLYESGMLAMRGARVGELTPYTIRSTVKEDGKLVYGLAPLRGGEPTNVYAQNASYRVIASVPLLGYWVRAVAHPIGALGLLGIPLLTLALDLVLSGWALRPLSRMGYALRRAAQGRRVRARSTSNHTPSVSDVVTRDEEAEDASPLAEYESARVMYTAHRNARDRAQSSPGEAFGMTVRLPRAPRFGV